jgi:hypothetical protein
MCTKYRLQTSTSESDNLLPASLQISNSIVRFGDLTVVLLKTEAFWDVTLRATGRIFVFELETGGGRLLFFFFSPHLNQVCNFTTHLYAVCLLIINNTFYSTHCRIPDVNQHCPRCLSLVLTQVPVLLHVRQVLLPVR